MAKYLSCTQKSVTNCPHTFCIFDFQETGYWKIHFIPEQSQVTFNSVIVDQIFEVVLEQIFPILLDNIWWQWTPADCVSAQNCFLSHTCICYRWHESSFCSMCWSRIMATLLTKSNKPKADLWFTVCHFGLSCMSAPESTACRFILSYF